MVIQHEKGDNSYWVDLGSGRIVQVSLDIPSLLNLFAPAVLKVVAGDMSAEYRSGGDSKANGFDLQIRTNYLQDGPGPPFPYVLRLLLDCEERLHIRLGAPHTITDLSGNKLMKVGDTWKDSHRGSKWVSTILDENFPWPETGIAAGISLWAQFIYQDLVYRKYGKSLDECRPNLWP